MKVATAFLLSSASSQPPWYFKLFCLFLSCIFAKMTIKGGSGQACAACKYQRRKCSNDCPLRPYFPADKPQMFLNAHRLFGVCNITKILRKAPKDLKKEAMKSVIYESDLRARYPVHGCWGVIWQLHCQLQAMIEELRCVKMKLAMCKEQQQSHMPSDSSLEFGCLTASNQVIPEYDQPDIDVALMNLMDHNDFCAGNEDLMKSLRLEHSYCNNIFDNDQGNSSANQEIEGFQDYDDIRDRLSLQCLIE